MFTSKETSQKHGLRLSLTLNILLIFSSVVILALTMYVIFQPLYTLIIPLLLVVVVFCVIPLLKSNTTYSKPYIFAHGFLAIVAISALVYFAIQLIKDQMGVQCEGLMGDRTSCVVNMWLSMWVVSFFVSIPAAILCVYGIYTQLRLPN